MLEVRDVAFEIVDISENQDAWTYVVSVLGGKSTPIIEIDGAAYLGYDACRDYVLTLPLLTDNIHDYTHEGD